MTRRSKLMIPEVTARVLKSLLPSSSVDEDVKILTSKEAELRRAVETAKRRGETDETERKWVDQAETILVEARLLKDEINKDWSKRPQLSDRLAKVITDIDRKLREANKLKGASTSHDAELFLPDYLIPSESSKRALDQIMEALIDDDVSVVGLYGIGGVGKTTVASQLRKKAEESFLFNKVVMVKATTEGFSSDTSLIRTRIADLLGFKFDEENEDGSARLREEIQKVDKILIILDNVWKEPNLEAIGIPFDEVHKGCKILLTTRLLSVTSIRCHKTIQLHPLSTREQWKLFRRCSEINSGASNVTRQKKVVEAWEGLPLAIVTMGKKLKHKPQRWLTAAEKELRIPLYSPQCFYEDIYKQLKLSYDYLNDEMTKLCFLLCSLFQKDYVITTEELMRMAFGLGLFDNVQNVEFIEDAREQARLAISNLRSSLLLAQDKGQGIRMGAELFRGLAHWIASQQGQTFLAGANLTNSNKKEIIKWLNSCTAISLLKDQLNDISDGDHLDCSKLATLVIFTNPPGSIEYPSSFFQRMNNLKVLSLLGRSSPLAITLSSLSIEGLHLLTNLRVLRFQRHKIPGLGKLPGLVILAFMECEVNLSLDIMGQDLQSSLKLLNLSRCPRPPTIAPNLLKKLSSLEELCIGFDESSRNVLLELNSLNNLIALSLKLPHRCCPDGFVLPRLPRYGIAINIGDEGFDPQVPTRKALRVKAFPLNPFKEFFQDVEHLYLDTINECRNLIPSLDKAGLNGLQYLQLHDCSSMECLVDIRKLRVAEINKTEVRLNDVVSNITTIELVRLPKLSCLWKGEGRVEIKNLKVMTIRSCNRLRDYLFSTSIAEGLKQLEVLDIKSCSGLKRITGETEVPSSGPVSLPELKSVKIANCTGLESIFPSIMVEGLLQLRELDITRCPKLKHVFKNHEICYVEDLKLELPSLKRLVLKKLDGMERICFSTEFIVAPLEELEVEGCPLLEPFALALNKKMPAQMKTLRLGEVGSGVKNRDKDRLTRLVEWSPDLQRFIVGNSGVAFGYQCGFFFSRLKELELSYVTQLQIIWEDHNRISGLQNLSSLKLVGCNKLRYIFTLIFAYNLPRLKHLGIEKCHGLEHIIEKDQSLMLSEDERQSVCFPNLVEIRITNCKKLRSVFPVKVAQFPKLQKFSVVNAPQLRQIFVGEGGSDTKAKKEVVLPQLQELLLFLLPKLFSLTPAGYHFVFSSLSSMSIIECPNMKTSFTVDLSGFVHAETEVHVQLVPQARGDSEEIIASSNTIQSLELQGGRLTWNQDKTRTAG